MIADVAAEDQSGEKISLVQLPRRWWCRSVCSAQRGTSRLRATTALDVGDRRPVMAGDGATLLVTIYGVVIRSTASRRGHRGGVSSILMEAKPYGYRGKC